MLCLFSMHLVRFFLKYDLTALMYFLLLETHIITELNKFTCFIMKRWSCRLVADCPSELFYKSLWMIHGIFFPSRLLGLFPLDATDDTSDLYVGKTFLLENHQSQMLEGPSSAQVKSKQTAGQCVLSQLCRLDLERGPFTSHMKL